MKFPLLTLLMASALSPLNTLAQPTTVASVWRDHASVCPASAQDYGTYGSTKNFDITVCASRGGNRFYIGRERATGQSITVRGSKGRFFNRAYEYKLAYKSSGQCSLQVLYKNQVVLSELLVSHMFMTDPCMFR